MPKQASTLLKEYGYTEVQDGLFVPARPSSERWERVEGGWHCYAPVAASFGGGEPWGRVLDLGLMQVPYCQSEAFASASGLSPSRNPAAFEWVWPEERLVEIYEHVATPGKGNEWVKTEAGYEKTAE